ncbi:pyridoxal phosphate-dependent transferase [Xylariales sp. PMI_506]|nr:pyridoxal phosphate-dependent transferase [Xylariales sp. PMI_506]
MALSQRGKVIANYLDVPWGYPSPGDYNAQTNPEGLIAFSTAENMLVTEELGQFAQNVRISAEAFGYRFSMAGGPHFPKVLAVHLNEYFKPYAPLTGDEILVADTATALNEMLGFALAEPGDAILVSRPMYGRFELDFGMKAGVEILYADTHARTCFEPSVVQHYEAAVARTAERGTRIRAVLIVNPHNPLGKCYPRETIVEIMKFCQKHQFHLISDEMYGCSVFDSGEPDAVPFTSLLSIDPDHVIDTNLCHVLCGMSKDFGAAGMRIGAIVTQNKSVLKACRAQVQFHDPSGMSIVVATAMLEDRAWCKDFLDAAAQKLGAAYRHVTRGLSELGVGYLRGANAGFFVWVDLSPFLPEGSASQQDREIALARELVANGVFLHPGEEHSIEPGWFRLVYTQEPDVVNEGLRRLGLTIASLRNH